MRLFAELGRYGATKVYHLSPDDKLPTAAAAAAMAELAGDAMHRTSCCSA